MSKELTVRVYIKIDGNYRPWEDLTKEEQRKIGIALNDRALRAIGYIPINDAVEDKTA